MDDTRQAADGGGGGGSRNAGEAEGHRLGNFVLRRKLGTGGMGTVFLADNLADSSTVALKLVNTVSSGDHADVARFVRESNFLLALDHPNIVKAFEVGALGERYFLSMEYVPGDTLMRYIERDGRVEPNEALRIMRQVARALEYGSSLGLVHRDVKPANILVAPDGTAKLADMGLAILASREDLRLTAPGTILGTPAYMSPEQARAEHEVDVRADIYSLGCTFYHAICGRPPYPEDDSAIVVVQKHLYESPTRPRDLVPGLSRAAEAVILKCMEKDPDLRYQNPAELTRAIDTALVASGARSARPLSGARPAEALRPRTAQRPGSGAASNIPALTPGVSQDFAFASARPAPPAAGRPPIPRPLPAAPAGRAPPTPVPTRPAGASRSQAASGTPRTTGKAPVSGGTGGGLDTRMVFLASLLIGALGVLAGAIWVLLHMG